MESVQVGVGGDCGAIWRSWRTLALIGILSLCLLGPCRCDKIEVLLVGHMGQMDAFRKLILGEPLLDIVMVPCRADETLTVHDCRKYIRLYFPRTSEEMGTYGFILLTAVEYDLLTIGQDRLMYDAIREGTGAVNDGSLFSIVGTIMTAWENSMTSKALPNDVSAVAGRGWRSPSPFRVVVDRDFRDPVLRLFLPHGVEKAHCEGVSGMVIPREGAGTLAWQEGNFPTRHAYLAVWDYEKGRTYTCGSFIPGGWFNYYENPYSPEILINMIFYSTKRGLIQDIEVFHLARSSMMQFYMRMGILVSLRDFVDKYGANTATIEDRIFELDALYEEGVDHYSNLEFSECKVHMDAVLAQFTEAEKLAMEIKDQALLWVYLVEWSVVSSTLLISGFMLWTLMVRRAMYRAIGSTRQRGFSGREGDSAA